MAHKKKATLGGRQFGNTKHKHGDDSRYQAGGRFLFAFITLGCLSRKSSSANLVGAGSVFGGICLARAFSCWREMILCKSNLRCSAKISSADRCFLLIVLTCKAMRRSTSRHGADSDYSDSLALRRWRRLISPFAAVTKKPAVLSPGSLSCSISSITSCGILTVVICDFAFFAPVAISGSPKNWCMSVYAKKMIKKGLKCISPVSKLKSKGEIHLKEQRPAVLATHAGRLTTNDSNSIEVAMLNHTTHPQGRDSHNLNKYIWRFIALSTAQPRVITIEASSEQEARQQSPAGCVMVFAARIRQGVCHA
ncbi:TPA: host cell division inhibitor Icd-like protein [Escherichia coli]|nr:host cell division inhibitor Icd-like protein [Escherichia coli]HAM4632329.1 ash family protein [Escherichia coli]HBL7172607.1 host cell division inhibitor Icd-like protein [Escherichia coli]